MPELKQALTYEQQVTRLTEHNLKFSSCESAIAILKKVNYYRLSAYGIGLAKPDDKEQYIDGITLESLYRLYLFDSLLRNQLVHVIEQLEVQLRTQVSNHLGIEYGPEGYMEAANFIQKYTKDGSSIHTITIEKFKQECIHQRDIPFVKHHALTYDGHFPIWVAIELFTFGNLASLFDIMSPTDKKVIASLYCTDPNYLNSWILALVEVRNICAHYGRLYNLPLKQAPFLYNENRKYRTGSINKLFPTILTIRRMLQSDERWREFATALEAIMDTYSDVIRLSFIGFPPDWKTILLK